MLTSECYAVLENGTWPCENVRNIQEMTGHKDQETDSYCVSQGSALSVHYFTI